MTISEISMIDPQQLLAWLTLEKTSPEDLVSQIRANPVTPQLLALYKQKIPLDAPIPETRYSVYRQFETVGKREVYQQAYFLKRAMLSHATLCAIMGDDSVQYVLHDLLWSICEETTWVLPAHEEQGPLYWDIRGTVKRLLPLHQSKSTMLTRQPESIDLFAAETGASLAEVIHLLNPVIAPEVSERVRQEIERRILTPYFASGRHHWWFKADLNWNGVCNGAIGVAFMRLENDPQRLVQALMLVLEGLETYIDTGFEADGGSVEGPGYWNYGLTYYVILAEMLRHRTDGELDLLDTPRMQQIAEYIPAITLTRGHYINFGDAKEQFPFNIGAIQRLADRTANHDLQQLLPTNDEYLKQSQNGAIAPHIAKLAPLMRQAAWWQGDHDTTYQPKNSILPDCKVMKWVGHTKTGTVVTFATHAGHNDGHHSQTDVGSFIYHVGGESLLPDLGPGEYTRDYFREARYSNIYNNSLGHHLPSINGELQQPGPAFFGDRLFRGAFEHYGEANDHLFVVIDLTHTYAVGDLRGFRRRFDFYPTDGSLYLEDTITSYDGALAVEEGFVTSYPIHLSGEMAVIHGERSTLTLQILEPVGCQFDIEDLSERAQHDSGDSQVQVHRLVASLPTGATTFRMKLIPTSKAN